MVMKLTERTVFGKEEVLERAREIIKIVHERHSTMQSIPKKDIEKFEAKLEKLYDRAEKSKEDTLIHFFRRASTFAIEELDLGVTIWELVAGALYIEHVKYVLYEDRGVFGYDYSFYELHKNFAELGIDATAEGTSVFANYTKEELEEASKWIDREIDLDLKYLSAHALMNSYMEIHGTKDFLSLPQERYLTVALFLTQKVAKEKRMAKAKELYWHLSNRTISPATPIMTNSNKKEHQLSSCFIDTTADNLDDIYRSNKDLANVSKYGGGVGVYMGKVRSKGSWIKGVKGVSSGTLPWIKQLNNTAVSVDQLGQRPGAIAVYLDIWHADVEIFLDLKLNNGDERMRAHDIFTGLCIPDLFMEKLKAREDWYLFDPYEVEKVMGFRLEDYYDEEKGSGTFRTKYQECVDNPILQRKVVPAIDIAKRYLRSQFETGTPFMFYRDTVNRDNPNKHEGMIYSSNLCTEIAQNMSETNQVEVIELEDGSIATITKPGDFVVCNLFSINLPQCKKLDVLEEAVGVSIETLDHTIELNNLPVKQAEITNRKYRSLGLGTLGWDHLRVLEGLRWDSKEILKYADKLYEDIAYYAIKKSMELSKEHGSYEYFEGSDWHNGSYFERRGYFEGENKERWIELAAEVKEHGMRNAYLLATAPNSTTSMVMGTSASTDPYFNTEFTEEKKEAKLRTVAADINGHNIGLYHSTAYHADQFWSVKQAIVRQRHIDQAISFNLYIPNNTKAIVLMNLQEDAFEGGVKTIYYTRSTAIEIQDCEWCHA